MAVNWNLHLAEVERRVDRMVAERQAREAELRARLEKAQETPERPVRLPWLAGKQMLQ